MPASDAEDAETQSELIQEIAFLVPEVETTCNICHAEFLDSEDLDIHLKQMHSVAASSNLCQFCDAHYTDFDDYAVHIRNKHLLELKCCHYCTKSFIDQVSVKKHEKKHISKDKMISCSQCTGLFTSAKEVELHELVNHDNTVDGVFIKGVVHLSTLLNLKVIPLLQSEEKIFICHICDFSSVDFKAYVEHLKEGKCLSCLCDKCGDIFKTKKNLIKHFKKKIKCLDVKEYTSELTTCPTCKNEVHSRHMRAHLKICRIYKCYICDIVFATIDELSEHQSDVHPSELDIVKCQFCPKEYVSQDALDKHMDRAHKQNFHLYKYTCKKCDSIFKHPQKLFAHYFTHHKQLQPYTCRICNKKFRVRKGFTIHIKVDHKGAGFVEFDDQYHVFFTDKKSEKPFLPKCVIPELLPTEEEKRASEKARKARLIKNQAKKVSHLKKFNSSKDIDIENDTNENTAAKLILDSDDEDLKTRASRKRKRDDFVSLSSSDEDEGESLLILKKRAERKKFQEQIKFTNTHPRGHMVKKKQFTCDTCNKYCYTYQNYHNHMKTHSKGKTIECIKCSKTFKNKTALTDHVAKDHATSKLIETLKNILERKQSQNPTVATDSISSSEKNFECLLPSERFLKTIQKVKVDVCNIHATISPARSNLSVKKFIENFMPDITESSHKEMKSEPSVVIKRYNSPFYRKSSIKLTKFTPEKSNEAPKLKMPERFKVQSEDKVILNVKLVQQPIRQSMFESNENNQSYDHENYIVDDSQDNDLYEDYKNGGVPDIAQEVNIEGTEEPPRRNVQAPQKIVIPKLPKGYKNVHIATLQPQAPFFKIIKVKGDKDEPIIIDTESKKKEPAQTSTSLNKEVIRLPDGTKFVTANPLAHLLGDKPAEKVLESLRNKHYKPVITNFKGMLAEAFQNLDNPAPIKPKKPKVQQGQKSKPV